MKKLMIAAALTVFLAGCESGQERIETQTAPKRNLLVIAVDVSKSTHDLRGKFIQTARDLALAANPKDTEIRVIKFGGSSPDEFYCGAIDDERKFRSSLRAKLTPDDPVDRTDYGGIATRLSTDIAGSDSQTITIIMIGDGGNDYRWVPEREARYQASCDDLAKDPRINLVRFWGVNGDPSGSSPGGGPRAEIRHLFAKFGDRLQIRTTNQDAFK